MHQSFVTRVAGGGSAPKSLTCPRFALRLHIYISNSVFRQVYNQEYSVECERVEEEDWNANVCEKKAAADRRAKSQEKKRVQIDKCKSKRQRSGQSKAAEMYREGGCGSRKGFIAGTERTNSVVCRQRHVQLQQAQAQLLPQ